MGSLVDFDVQMTLIDGDVVAEDGRALFEVEGTSYPEWILNTMHLVERSRRKPSVSPR